jgi:selenocysteine lyase/cysteine desulfurase
MPHLSTPKRNDTNDALITQIREGVIGERSMISGPFGVRPLVYADFIASGRSLDFVETAIQNVVLPLYGNTHTETSCTGRQTTALREEARRTIADAVGATDAHAVIFTGNGATAAIDRLVRAMDIERKVQAGQSPVVFVGPYEHHSNDLPWRETGAIIKRIGLNVSGQIDLDQLASALEKYEHHEIKIGAFSAASNVTGVRSDLQAIATILHKNKAVFICDYAASAPYVDMNLTLNSAISGATIDAIIYSSHKFIGGPGASGVLIADKALFTSDRPAITGGGTVSYVTAEHHTYVKDIERREEAGTPGIVGDIRAGAVMALKQAVGADVIEAREDEIMTEVLTRLSAASGIHILGPKQAERIGVLSFNISCGEQRLHYGFVVALLNDLFGIQARGGCSCAGPYAHELLDIPHQKATQFEAEISDGQSLLRPGWVRLGFNYFFDEQTVDYIVSALLFIHEHGLKFLQDYDVNVPQGLWRSKGHAPTDTATLQDFWALKLEPKQTKFTQLDSFLLIAQELADARTLPILKKSATFTPRGEALRDFCVPQDISNPVETNNTST